MKNYFKKYLIFTLLFLSIFSIIHQDVFAGSSVLSLKIDKDVYLNSEFTLNVFLNTPESINAIDLDLFYPNKQISFVSSDNTGSFVDLWQKINSDNTGSIHLVGGILKPFSGQGLLIKLKFKALSVNNVDFSFKKNDAYVADGKGTKIVLDFKPLNIQIQQKIEDNKVVNTNKTNTESYFDYSPPEIFLKLTKSPIDNSQLIAFYVNDKESGIQKTEMRVKKYFIYSSWREVENPVLYQEGFWKIELKATNNVGLENVRFISLPKELCKNLFMVVLGIFVLVFVTLRVYNESNRNL